MPILGAKSEASPHDDYQAALNRMVLERRHPEYNDLLTHWNFCEATYNGGREWFTEENIYKYIKEGDDEFVKRLARAYRFNHTREVTDLVNKYIYKPTILRNEGDASKSVTSFWKNATLSGLDINQFAKLVSTMTSIFGLVWVVVDNTNTGNSLTIEEAKKERSYAYVMRPQDALDMGFSELGELEWILFREYKRDDSNPIMSSGEVTQQFRLWERNTWTLYEVENLPTVGAGGNKVRVVQIDFGEHNLGIVPAFPVKHVVCESQYSAPSLIGDIAYLDRAIANYLSNLDAIIQDQTFSQLVMPAQGVLPGTEDYRTLVDAGTKRIFIFDGEGGVAPAFISPDAKQAEIIVIVINKIINEIYHTIGMAGERTKQDNAVGIDNSSGVAKAYDFERMNSLLTSKADSLENFENELVNLIEKWNGNEPPKNELVKYPDTFDVRSLFDEFTIAERLKLSEAPNAVRREQMKQVIEKLFPRIAADLKSAIMNDLKNWPPKDSDLSVTTSIGGTKQPAKFPTTGKKTSDGGKTSTSSRNPQTESRQGQVTSDTGKSS